LTRRPRVSAVGLHALEDNFEDPGIPFVGERGQQVAQDLVAGDASAVESVGERDDKARNSPALRTA